MNDSPGFLQAQDPDEHFDIVDADGNPTGVTKRRADVHRDGDWHRAVHAWIFGVRDDRPFLLFQRRGMFKDTAPGKLDPTIGGHYAAGESIDDVWREVKEEIGVPAVPDEMSFAGVRIRSSERESNIIDREIQDVYLWRRDHSLETYRPNAAELDGLVEVDIHELIGIFAGSHDRVMAKTVSAKNPLDGAVHTELLAFEFLPSVDRYPYRVAVAALGLLRGDRWIAV